MEWCARSGWDLLTCRVLWRLSSGLPPFEEPSGRETEGLAERVETFVAARCCWCERVELVGERIWVLVGVLFSRVSGTSNCAVRKGG